MRRSLPAALLLPLSVLPWSPASAQLPEPDPGRNLAAACAACHGTNGSNAGHLPSLAGQPADYLARQMRDFRDARRPATVMHQISRGYTEGQIESMANFFAAQKTR